MREKRPGKCYFRGRLFLCLLALLFASCYGDPEKLDIKASKEEIHANGEETITVIIRVVDAKGRTVKNAEFPVEVSVSGADVVTIGQTPVMLEEGTKDLTLISTFESGSVKVTAAANGINGGEANFIVVPDYRDGDGDGFPDVVELFGDTDRLNFRRWLCAVAESQLYEKNRRWADVNNDCAGLIRFAYSEALKLHDTRFFSVYSALVNPANPDIKKYNYPNVPLLGEKIFRTGDGPFFITDIEEGAEKFSPSATAGHLLLYNVIPLGKGGEGILPGDLIFYFNPDNQKMPYHAMIFLGEWGTEEDGDDLTAEGKKKITDDWVVYHTGPRHTDRGEVRKVRLSTLMQHPEMRWRPVTENENFLGFFRFKILD
ncbi:MAG: DUF1175 family protein [Deltaproteobacteria bacterium]|uniref:DUF1175 family protein n=1 Tax=Candidatus Zymogenus saltonus TaxID=2844893 RepID=A0A9D8PPG1_9DELT|nr:DUF1175 family protein [Candidatus Zymogenus saltonus]